MSRRADNDEERFARIDALMEEYRIRHEDLRDYLQQAERRAREHRASSRLAVDAARARFARTKTRKAT